MGLKLLKEKGLRLRFVVGEIGGPWSGTWIAWANQGKGDLYVSSRSIAGDLKVSLHQSGECRVALTHQHLRRPNPVAGPKDHKPLVWQMTENMGVPGLSRPLVINIPTTELDATVPPPKKAPVVFIPQASESQMTEISVVFTSPEVQITTWPGAATGTGFVAVFDLDLLGKAWFVYRDVPITSQFRARLEADRSAMNQLPVPPERTAAEEPSVYRGILISDLQNDTRALTELLIDPSAPA